jgi:hypothetical protein
LDEEDIEEDRFLLFCAVSVLPARSGNSFFPRISNEANPVRAITCSNSSLSIPPDFISSKIAKGEIGLTTTLDLDSSSSS